MSDNLKRVVVVVGTGVPSHMLARLHDAGMLVVSPDFGEDEKVEPEYVPLIPTWYDEASDITPEMFESLKDYRAKNTIEFGGMRAGKTAAMEDRLDALDRLYGERSPQIVRLTDMDPSDSGMLNHAAPEYIYDSMGFRHVRPPARREIEFIDTPKPISRRKARRMRGKKS